MSRIDSQRLSSSFAACAQITRARAGNFYHGLKLLPEPKRSAMYALYAWMRAVDDLADEPDSRFKPAGDKFDQLSRFRQQTERACRGELEPDPMATSGNDFWPAVQHTFVTYQVPQTALLDMIAGQMLDQTKTRYQNFVELEQYCYQVASTVGLCCLSIWGHDDQPSTQQMAVHRGIALQLTNILRDIVEDAQRDRLYLPADELVHQGIDPAGLLRELPQRRLSVPPEVFASFMRQQIERAQGYYRASAGLENRLPGDSRAACWAMGEIYHRLLQHIATDPLAVLRRRVSLPRWRKLGIGLRATFSQPWAGPPPTK